MNKNWNVGIIASIMGRLLGIIAILAFVYLMVALTSSFGCLWLLFLLLVVDFIPIYSFERDYNKNPDKKENKNGNKDN